MRSFLFAVLTAACTCTLGAIASAQQYHSPQTYFTPRQCRVCPSQSNYTHYTPNHNNVHHRQIVRLIDVAQINPAYVSSYSPDGYDSATQQAIKAQISLLSQQLNALSQQLATRHASAPPPTPPQPGAGARLPTPNPAPTAPPVTVPPLAPGVPPVDKGAGNAAIGLAVLSAKCAVCHQDGKLAPDQKFTLLDIKGAVVPLTDKQKLRVLLKTYSGQMPPPNNIQGIPAITDAEFAAVAALISLGAEMEEMDKWDWLVLVVLSFIAVGVILAVWFRFLTAVVFAALVAVVLIGMVNEMRRH